MFCASLIAAVTLLSMLASAAPTNVDLDNRAAAPPNPFAVKVSYTPPGAIQVNNTWLEAGKMHPALVGFNENRSSGTIFIVAENGDLKFAKEDLTAAVPLGGKSQFVTFNTPQELASGKKLCIKCTTKKREFLCTGGSYEPNMSKLVVCLDTPLGTPLLYLVDKNYSSSQCQPLKMLSTTDKQT